MDPELAKQCSPSNDNTSSDRIPAADCSKDADVRQLGYEEGAAARSPAGAKTPTPGLPAASCDLPPSAAPAKLPAATTLLKNRRFAGDATLEAIAAGTKTMGQGQSGDSVRKVQAALESLGKPLGKHHADGSFGKVTHEGVEGFQTERSLTPKKAGVVDAATMQQLDTLTPQASEAAYAWSEAEFNTGSTPARAKLSNPRFVGDLVLEQIQSGVGAVVTGAKGPHVWKVQSALEALGFKTKVNGTFDAETKKAVGAFQAAFNVPLKPSEGTTTFANDESQSGGVNPTTMACLDAYAPKSLPKDSPDAKLSPTGGPDYAKLFEDGKFDVTLAFGFDEGGAHIRKQAPLIQQLTAEMGFTMTDPRVATADELTKAGLDAKTVDKETTYFTRSIQSKTTGKKVDVTVKFLAPKEKGENGAAIKDKYKAALETDDAVLYTGHARAGTGPDFDAHDTTAGNYKMGKGYDKKYNKEVADADNQLDATKFTDKYQVLQFWGCTTEHYDKHLDKRLGKRGTKDALRNSKDVVVTKEPVYSNRGVLGVVSMIRGLVNEASGAEIQAMLNAADRADKAKLEGFKQ